MGEYMEIFSDARDENCDKLEAIFCALKANAPNLKAWIFGHWHNDGNFALDFNGRALPFFCLYNENAIVIDGKKNMRFARIC